VDPGPLFYAKGDNLAAEGHTHILPCHTDKRGPVKDGIPRYRRYTALHSQTQITGIGIADHRHR
jgi:hypothetical protein